MGCMGRNQYRYIWRWGAGMSEEKRWQGNRVYIDCFGCRQMGLTNTGVMSQAQAARNPQNLGMYAKPTFAFLLLRGNGVECKVLT